jgi:hypothetical protein
MHPSNGPVLVITASLLLGLTSWAPAQGYSPGTLGGYGAASTYANPSMGGGGPMVIPYGGMFEGFMPSRMGGGSALAFRSRPTAAMGSARTSFSLAPMSGGMGAGAGVRTRPMSGFGVGAGSGGMTRMRGPGGTSVMPPSFGYPFRQPPSLLSTPSPGAGMSM